MSWRGPRTARDPIYTTAEHRAAIKYWRIVQAPCAECHKPIDYSANGQHSPWALHVDHIVAIAIGRAQGWPDSRIAHMSNTRPLHRRCNTRLGAQLGQKRQASRLKTIQQLDQSRRW